MSDELTTPADLVPQRIAAAKARLAKAKKPAVVLNITNRSQWPYWFVVPVCEWIARRVGLPDDVTEYRVLLKSTKRRWGFRGRAHIGSTQITLHRRLTPPHGWPYEHRYPRYRWFQTCAMRCRLEVFVYVVAHEMGHSVGDGRPGRVRLPDGRLDAATMELACERLAAEVLDDFRREWKHRLRARVAKLARQHHAEAKASSPEAKLADAEASVRQWRRKLRMATTMVRRHQRRAHYYASKLRGLDGSRRQSTRKARGTRKPRKP